MEHHLLTELVILLGLAVVVAIPVRRLGLPMIIGYMAVGVLVGPHVLDLLRDEQQTRFLAELGVLFLMFMVGLEFSVSTMIRARRLVFGRGGAQVLTVVAVAATTFVLSTGIGWPIALVLGGALAMSSTAIGLKQLSDQGELNSRHGRSVVSMLLFQDLATLPLLVVIPVLAGSSGDGALGIGASLGRAALAFVLLLALGRWALRPLMDRVAAVRSHELFVLMALLVVLGTAYGAGYAGLSSPIGAFLVGMMLGETRYKHQMAEDIRPFRDVLLGLFFVTVGMRLDLEVLPGQWLATLAVFVGLTLVKTPLIVGLMRAFRVESPVAVRIGVVLGHGGEFGLLIITLALQTGLVGPAVGQPVLAGIVLSMVAAPFMIRFNDAIARGLTRADRTVTARGAVDRVDHVILCGYGHVGRHLARLLEARGIAWVAVDNDPAHVDDAEDSGHPVLFGDASRLAVLEAAGLRKARCVVVSVDDAQTARTIVEHVRAAGERMPILASVAKSADARMLIQAGATQAIPEGLSASLMVGEHLLRMLGVEDLEVQGAIEQLRAGMPATP